ncbi:flagellar basal body P-ring formation chaperone FlgA [Sulfitobacter sabulilitoris]|uniref:Flagella basal body P-ring formation protein FlgA n=1 Tax=Sulfitobacter sabulilitoris TaxID=2562655 RepID=A0A5S3PEP1_9RHOB|nr:flagellar basal body P-ring formation chaperone FlgA [Sulfitobacter sabulilitoris]TMM52505.1 flagellar basal body P-ring formation protein FlgA [Sulfitobacter sabulilitoris]
MRCVAILVAVCLGGVALADTVVPARTIRAAAIITEIDLGLVPGDTANGFSRLRDVAGQEARRVLYAGRPIRVDDIGPPALVDRNQIVILRYQGGGLSIVTEGRALERGGLGDRIRVMNLTSRNTLFGQVKPDGSVQIFQ